MRQMFYLTLATGRVWLISFSYAYNTWVAMWDRFFPTVRLHRDHSILYAFVCEKEISHMPG